ncbi:hypothetical protein [Thiofilum flexile]|uniref:hypothetical protein n=1 Tax=Thiofilum flexile TaxID=125627 RepID=UPI0003699111|nr:hypothetical protein [Thiofilum flexile]
MSDTKVWWIGFTLIITFIFIGHLVILLPEYAYRRLGLSRDLILLVLWLLSIIASFVVVTLSEKRGVLMALALALISSTLDPLVHFLSGQLGATIDFAGLSGLKITFQISLILNLLTIGIGAFLGLILKKT